MYGSANNILYDQRESMLWEYEIEQYETERK